MSGVGWNATAVERAGIPEALDRSRPAARHEPANRSFCERLQPGGRDDSTRRHGFAPCADRSAWRLCGSPGCLRVLAGGEQVWVLALPSRGREQHHLRLQTLRFWRRARRRSGTPRRAWSASKALRRLRRAGAGGPGRCLSRCSAGGSDPATGTGLLCSRDPGRARTRSVGLGRRDDLCSSRWEASSVRLCCPGMCPANPRRRRADSSSRSSCSFDLPWRLRGVGPTAGTRHRSRFPLADCRRPELEAARSAPLKGARPREQCYSGH